MQLDLRESHHQFFSGRGFMPVLRVRALKRFMTWLLPVSIAAAVSIVMFGFPSRGYDRFEQIFRQSLASGSYDENIQLNRWASRFDVCIYGGRSESTKKLVLLFFDIVREVTWLRPTIGFKPDIVACPNSTFLYVHLHQGEENFNQTAVGELALIMTRAGMTKPIDARLSQYGMGLSMIEIGLEPRLYVAINEFEGATLEVDKLLARNVVQQELLQVLLNASDLKVDQTPVSIIEERRVPNVPDSEDDADPKNRTERAKLNVPNMCLYDVMLLMTLYARDESIADARLGPYIRYIRKNFHKLEQAARAVQNNPRYHEIFSSRC
ncbi:hypothetical protein JNB71_22920 [Rhizobium herbae]|uniref:DUF1194 domain-containing protein n=1 Tax=Rhizobium herbae TaxID=508661 RepID=A0ABS7HI98_9HYPH|nr:hypothetical protein [Rhizobium herbae]MBW9066164.1 hypothetical protein [Rhizobium herbae]